MPYCSARLDKAVSKNVQHILHECIAGYALERSYIRPAHMLAIWQTSSTLSSTAAHMRNISGLEHAHK
jgi:hypothetical protein